MKVCSTCGKNKPVSEYYRRSSIKSGFRSACKVCAGRQSSDYIRRNRDAVNARKRKYNRKLREAALKAYGNLCQCCGEAHKEFLAIDHVNGGGRAHRKSYRDAGNYIFLWLRQRKYPKGFQVLCHNCNMAKGFYGECPHKREKN